MDIKESLRPTRKDLVIDTVEAAGIDVSAWRASGNNANPAFCYEWAFAEPQKGILLLFLWFDELVEREGDIVEEGNLRGLIKSLEATSSPKGRRARRLDEALQDAWRKKWTIRVGIVMEKDRRATAREDRDSNHADFRELDPAPWTLDAYYFMSGDYLLRRVPEAVASGEAANLSATREESSAEGQAAGVLIGVAEAGRQEVESEGVGASAVENSAPNEPAMDSAAEAELVVDLDELASRTDVPPTTRAALVEARLGQGAFRRALVARWSGRCAVTGCDQLAVLRASHVKPWRNSTDGERLDPDNGLLLVANLDALFDAGLIAFEDDGRMWVSASLTSDQQSALGVPARLREMPTARQREYLKRHREWAKHRQSE